MHIYSISQGSTPSYIHKRASPLTQVVFMTVYGCTPAIVQDAQVLTPDNTAFFLH